MMWDDLKINADAPAYQQIKDYIRDLIINGSLQNGVRLPSTRELSQILKVGRNTVIMAYEELQNEELIENFRGRGAYVTAVPVESAVKPRLNWNGLINEYGQMTLDLIQTARRRYPWRKGMISFHNLAPDESIFDVEEIKKAFLNRISLEGEKLLNYGEGKGYRPLIHWLKRYLEDKGVDFRGKDLLITNGFTDSFNLAIYALTKPGDSIVCENPTSNLALNAMRLAGLKITGIEMQEDGIHLERLEQVIAAGDVKLGFVMPSYHNPTGLVMSAEKRFKVLEMFEKYRLPLIEEGFNEELRYSGSHLSPLITLAGTGNQVIYLGSFSKILFPAIRAGWVVGDYQLIACLESIKLHRNIYSPLLDQAVLYEYLQQGNLQQYLKKAKRLYKEKYEKALQLAEKHIPYRAIRGDGGLHLFIELKAINTRELLDHCYQRGVLFTPGDMFYSDGAGSDTLRLSITRVNQPEMEKGIKIIGEEVQALTQSAIP